MMKRSNSMIAALMAVMMVLCLVLAPTAQAAAVEESFSNGSAEFKMSADGLDINAKLYVDAANPSAALTGTLNLGSQVVDAALFVTENALMLKSDALLDQVYGIDLGKLAENLPNSVFAPDSGSAYALDQETLDSLTQTTPASAFTGALTVDPQFGEALEKYVEVIVKDITDNMEMAMNSQMVNVNGEEIDTSAVTVTIPTAAMTAVVTDVLTMAADDAELKDAIANVYDQAVAAGMVEGATDATGAETVAALWESLPQAKDEAVKSLTDSMAEVSVSMNTSKETENLIAASVIISMNQEPVVLSYFTNEDGSFTTVEMSASGESLMACYYIVEENTDDAYAAVFMVTEGETEDMHIATTWNKVTGAYTFEMATPEQSTTVTGTIKTTDDSITITIETIDGQSVGDMSVTLKANDSITAPASFTEIMTMSEEELNTALQGAMDLIGGVIG